MAKINICPHTLQMQLKLCEYKSEKLTLECMFNAFRYSAFMQMHYELMFHWTRNYYYGEIIDIAFAQNSCVISIIPLSLQFVRKYTMSAEWVVYYIIYSIGQPTQRRNVSGFLLCCFSFFFFETMKIFLERPLMRTKQVEKQVKYL